jgi:hypothetical protein
VLRSKYSLIHVLILDKNETRSNFARIESGDGAREVKVEEKFEGSVYISALGGLNRVHVKTWVSNRMIILCGRASAPSAESKLNEKKLTLR